MSIHTILSQQRKEFEKLKVCCPLCGWRTGLVYHECHVCRGFIGNVFNWYLSFATRIVEEAQIEERERIKKILPVAARINNSGVVTIDYQEWVFFIRKIDSGTKLQKMKGEV